MDNVDDPPNADDASYGDTISGVEYQEEEPHHEENTDCHHQGHPPETQQQYPSETQDEPTAEHTRTTDT